MGCATRWIQSYWSKVCPLGIVIREWGWRMSKARMKIQRVLVLLLVVIALVLVAGCGGGNSESPGSSDGGESNASEAAPTKRALATMPSARFAAPTTMITPQSGEAETVDATATMTATEEIADSEEITETEEVTSTEEMTDAE